VTRGLGTVGYIPVGWEEGPAHASLISMNHKPLSEEDVSPSIHKTVWALLIGAIGKDESDEKLILLASSWLNPADLKVESEGSELKGYDQLQRAYVLECEPNVSSINLRMEPKAKMINPVFVLKNLAKGISEVSLDGKRLSPDLYRWGIEVEGNRKDLVLWLEAEIEKPTQLAISLLGE